MGYNTFKWLCWPRNYFTLWNKYNCFCLSALHSQIVLILLLSFSVGFGLFFVQKCLLMMTDKSSTLAKNVRFGILCKGALSSLTNIYYDGTLLQKWFKAISHSRFFQESSTLDVCQVPKQESVTLRGTTSRYWKNVSFNMPLLIDLLVSFHWSKNFRIVKWRLKNVIIELSNASKVTAQYHNIETQQMGFNAEVNYTYWLLKWRSDELWFLPKTNINP